MTRKTHSNAWGESLPEELRWKLYDTLGSGTFGEATMAAIVKAGAPLPTRAGWYRFLARMRQADAARRIEKVAQSVAEAQSIADRHGIKSAILVETLKTLAVDRAMTGDDAAAQRFAAAAAGIWDRAQKERELELKAARQKTAEEQLKLAREKFEAAEKRLAAVQGAVDEPQLSDAERVAKIKSIFGMK